VSKLTQPQRHSSSAVPATACPSGKNKKNNRWAMETRIKLPIRLVFEYVNPHKIVVQA
jgi:hypothetical protein